MPRDGVRTHNSPHKYRLCLPFLFSVRISVRVPLAVHYNTLRKLHTFLTDFHVSRRGLLRQFIHYVQGNLSPSHILFVKGLFSLHYKRATRSVSVRPAWADNGRSTSVPQLHTSVKFARCHNTDYHFDLSSIARSGRDQSSFGPYSG